MPKFIYTIAVDVEAVDQDEATWLIYNIPLTRLNTDCLEIEVGETE